MAGLTFFPEPRAPSKMLLLFLNSSIQKLRSLFDLILTKMLRNIKFQTFRKVSIATSKNSDVPLYLHQAQTNTVVVRARGPRRTRVLTLSLSRYRVSSFDFSLDDIEHGILRESPAGDPRSFSDDDPRKFLAVEKVSLITFTCTLQSR